MGGFGGGLDEIQKVAGRGLASRRAEATGVFRARAPSHRAPACDVHQLRRACASTDYPRVLLGGRMHSLESSGEAVSWFDRAIATVLGCGFAFPSTWALRMADKDKMAKYRTEIQQV